MFVPSVTRAAELKRQMMEQQAHQEVRGSRYNSNGSSPPLPTDGAPVVLITTLKRKHSELLSEVSIP